MCARGKVMPRSDIMGHGDQCRLMEKLERCTVKASARVDNKAVDVEDNVKTLSGFSLWLYMRRLTL